MGMRDIGMGMRESWDGDEGSGGRQRDPPFCSSALPLALPSV